MKKCWVKTGSGFSLFPRAGLARLGFIGWSSSAVGPGRCDVPAHLALEELQRRKRIAWEQP